MTLICFYGKTYDAFDILFQRCIRSLIAFLLLLLLVYI